MYYINAVAEAKARVRVRAVSVLILRLGGGAEDDTARKKTSAQFEQDEFEWIGPGGGRGLARSVRHGGQSISGCICF